MTTKVHLPVCRHENLFGIVSAPIETQSGTIGEFFVSQVRDVAAQIPALMENGDISIEVGYPPSDNDDPIRPLSKSTWRLKIELNISAPDDSLRREAVMGICYLIYNSVKNQSPLPDDPTLIEQTRIEVVSPNWIIGGADQVKIPTGGPGSNKADVNLKREFPFVIPVLDTLIAGNVLGRLNVNSRKVAVVIMDTDLPDDQAVAHWSSQAATDLRDNLNIPVPTIAVRPPAAVTTASTVHTSDLSPHSLFVTGIIRSIAKKYGADSDHVNLYVIPILNNGAEGSLDSFLSGFDKLRELRTTQIDATTPIIVNFSADFPWSPEQILTLLVAQIPRSQSEDRDLAQELIEQDWVPPTIKRQLRDWLTTAAKNKSLADDFLDDFSEFIKFLVGFTTIACDLNQFGRDKVQMVQGTTAQRGALVPTPVLIAAAGNESAWRMNMHRSWNRFGTAYPASLSNIVGVGALDKNGNKTDYSNEADIPDSSGFWVLGGGAAMPVDEITPPNVAGGVISLYTGSPTGWAQWSGTSFATAIMTGIVAVVLSDANVYMPLREIWGVNQSTELTVSQP